MNKPIIERPKRLTDQVVDFIIEEIESGTFKLGDSLPSEADLKEICNVSRAVIREAMAVLKRDGIIGSRQGERSKIIRTIELRPFDLQFTSDQEKKTDGLPL